MHRMLDLARSHCCRAYNERAVGDGFGNARAFCRIAQQLGRADSRLRFAKGELVAVDDTEMQEAEVAHGSRSRSDVERVARRHQHYDDAVELGCSQQE